MTDEIDKIDRSIELYDEDRGMLSLATETLEVEFKIAAAKAAAAKLDEFEFYGFIVETETAVEVVAAINKIRTYH